MTAELNGTLRLDLEPVVLAMAREQAGIMGLDLDRCEPAAVERLKQQLLGTLVVGLPVVLEQLVAAGWRAPEEAPPARDERPHSRACGIRRHDHGSDCAPDCPTCHPEPVLPRWPYEH